MNIQVRTEPKHAPSLHKHLTVKKIHGVAIHEGGGIIWQGEDLKKLPEAEARFFMFLAETEILNPYSAAYFCLVLNKLLIHQHDKRFTKALDKDYLQEKLALAKSEAEELKKLIKAADVDYWFFPDWLRA